MSQNAFSKIGRGETDPTYTTLERIAAIFQTDLSNLTGFDDKRMYFNITENRDQSNNGYIVQKHNNRDELYTKIMQQYEERLSDFKAYIQKQEEHFNDFKSYNQKNEERFQQFENRFDQILKIIDLKTR